MDEATQSIELVYEDADLVVAVKPAGLAVHRSRLVGREDDYLVDRQRQKSVSFSAVTAITDQDRSLQENMRSQPGFGPGRRVDRSREMLVPSDLPVITARRMLLKQAKELQRGTEPAMAHRPEGFNHRSLAAMSAESSFEGLLQSSDLRHRMR